MTRLSFPNDTKDDIEKIWWRVISPNYPFYGTFWEDFIGRQSRPVDLAPYGLRIPLRIGSQRRAQIRAAYYSLAMSHYSAFCELAGAHFQLSRAKAAESAGRSASQLFKFTESFNVFYDHLGTSRNMMNRMWCQLGIMEGPAFQRRLATPVKAVGGGTLVGRFLRARRDHSTLQRLRKVEKEVITLRDDHIHNFSAYFAIIGSVFALLPPRRVNVARAKLHRLPKLPISACVKMERDVVAVENLLDRTERHLARELSTWLKREGILVRY